MHFQRTIAATCGVLLIGGVATGIWWGADINVKLQEKETSNQSLIQELRNSEAENEAKEIAHKSTVDELNKKLQEQEAVLVSREGFLAAIAEAKAVIAMAEGKVDSSAELTELVAAQDTVAAERKSATVVQEQAAKISAIAASLKTRVEAFDEEVRKASEVNIPQRQSTGGGSDTRGSGGQTATPKRSSGGANSNSGGGNPPAAKPSRATITSGPAREALNAVGGGWVELGSADVVCGYEWAAACSHPGGYIELKNLYVNESYDFWYPLLMHEYAHQVQYQHYEAMYYSGEYARLFGNDIEWLADCMTYQRVPWYQSGYGYSCSQEQLNYAAGAWNGRY